MRQDSEGSKLTNSVNNCDRYLNKSAHLNNNFTQVIYKLDAVKCTQFEEELVITLYGSQCSQCGTRKHCLRSKKSLKML